jgi:multicomponent Na+:H+ antiporter subunit E
LGLRVFSQFAFLMAFWLLLSGHYDLAEPTSRYLLACGIATCGFVTWLARRRFGILDGEGHPIQLAPRALSYGVWLFWQIILSNWDVFKRVWSPHLRISPRLIHVPDETRSDLGSVIYANSITLTPGTVTVGIDPAKRELLVHCLHEAAGEDLRAGAMLAQVKRFEGLEP